MGVGPVAAADELASGAQEWLVAAENQLEARRLRVAFELFRHSAELAAKAMLARKLGSFPKEHSVAGLLVKEGIPPSDVDGKKLHRLLSRFTLGTYDFETPVHEADLQDARRLARRMVRACLDSRP